MKNLIIPELIYIMLLYGGIVLSLISVFMGIRGLVKKREKRYFIKWSIVLLLCLVTVVLTTTGGVVANTMIPPSRTTFVKAVQVVRIVRNASKVSMKTGRYLFPRPLPNKSVRHRSGSTHRKEYNFG